MTKEEAQNEMEISPEVLKKWRQENKYSYAQAARLVGADRTAWPRWERGLVKPSEEYQLKLRSLITEKPDRHTLFGLSRRTVNCIRASPGNVTMRLTEGARNSPSFAANNLLNGRMLRLDSADLDLLEILFEPSRSSEKVIPNAEARFFGTAVLMAFGGYFIGKLKYSTDDKNENWFRKAIGWTIADLIGMHALQQREFPKYADDLWYRASSQMLAGYSVAMDDQFWPESDSTERALLAITINDEEALKYLVFDSKLLANDFSDDWHGSLFDIIKKSARKSNHLGYIRKHLPENAVRILDETYEDLKLLQSVTPLSAPVNALRIKFYSLLRQAHYGLLRMRSNFDESSKNTDDSTMARFEHVVTEIDLLGREISSLEEEAQKTKKRNGLYKGKKKKT